MEFGGALSGLVVSVVGLAVDYVIPFLVAITVLVFVHELGHYLVARWCGVRVEVFSVGFGLELWGRTDSRATRWRLGAVPVGGYVKMYGEMIGAPAQREDGSRYAEDDARAAFHTQPLWRRTAIVAAGPLANFLFAVAVLAALFSTVGEPSTPAVIAGVVENSPAERAGFRLGDRIVGIDGARIHRFQQVVRIVRFAPGERLRFEILRDGRRLELTAVPETVRRDSAFGGREVIGRLGVASGGEMEMVHRSPAAALKRAVEELFSIIDEIFQALGQMFGGTRDMSELGGPLRIAQLSGDLWQLGIVSTLVFLATLSINLGLINLFPIPMLDGGHLMFYMIEAILGRPLSERACGYGYRIGIAMVLALMVFVTLNDLVQLEVFDFFVGLVT